MLDRGLEADAGACDVVSTVETVTGSKTAALGDADVQCRLSSIQAQRQGSERFSAFDGEALGGRTDFGRASAGLLGTAATPPSSTAVQNSMQEGNEVDPRRQ